MVGLLNPQSISDQIVQQALAAQGQPPPDTSGLFGGPQGLFTGFNTSTGRGLLGAGAALLQAGGQGTGAGLGAGVQGFLQGQQQFQQQQQQQQLNTLQGLLTTQKIVDQALTEPAAFAGTSFDAQLANIAAANLQRQFPSKSQDEIKTLAANQVLATKPQTTFDPVTGQLISVPRGQLPTGLLGEQPVAPPVLGQEVPAAAPTTPVSGVTAVTPGGLEGLAPRVKPISPESALKERGRLQDIQLGISTTERLLGELETDPTAFGFPGTVRGIAETIGGVAAEAGEALGTIPGLGVIGGIAERFAPAKAGETVERLKPLEDILFTSAVQTFAQEGRSSQDVRDRAKAATRITGLTSRQQVQDRLTTLLEQFREREGDIGTRLKLGRTDPGIEPVKAVAPQTPQILQFNPATGRIE